MNQLHDVTFQVTDIEAALDWYRSNFGADVVYAGAFRVLLQLEGASLALVQRNTPAADLRIGQLAAA